MARCKQARTVVEQDSARQTDKRRPVIKLAEVATMERCEFVAQFRCAELGAGMYVVSVFVWDDAGYGYFLPHELSVTGTRTGGPRSVSANRGSSIAVAAVLF